MKDINYSIGCDVVKCQHNVAGTNCALSSIKVTSDCTDCTCCQSYQCCDDCE